MSMFDRLAEELELLERHIEMLKVTKEFQPIGIIRLSEILKIPKHKVRYSLRLLEKEGLIIATSDGATVSSEYDSFMEEMYSNLDRLIDRINRVKAQVLR